ncbi:MAG: hypothetical protein ACREA7_04420 [Nitrosotalea sp.]
MVASIHGLLTQAKEMSTNSKQNKIRERRVNVQRLLFNCTNEEIAAELKVSTSTIKRDKAAIVKNDMTWLTNLPRETLLLDYSTIVYQTKDRIIELNKQFLDSTETEVSVQLSKEIRESAKFLMELYDDAAAVYLKNKKSEEDAKQN